VSAERDGRRGSVALAEARTVLSRAETALTTLEHYDKSDPAYPEIRAALVATINALRGFRRTGRGCPNCGAPGKPHVSEHRRPYRPAFTCEVPRG
jgi:hypothetical protein